MIMKSFSRRLAALVLAAFATAAITANTPPDALVQSTVGEVLSVMKQTKDKHALRELAEEKVLPRFDFEQMTKLAFGPIWPKASPQQQRSLANGFRALLLNTYTTSLSLGATPDMKFEVRPVRQSREQDVTVKTLIKEPGRQPIAIDYRMENQEDGWKVYDVLVEGVSLVTTYQRVFQEEVQRSGIDGLIKVLNAKNSKRVRG